MHCMSPLAVYLRTAHSSMVQFKCLSVRARSFGGKPVIRTWAWQIGEQGVEYCNELKTLAHCIPCPGCENHALHRLLSSVRLHAVDSQLHSQEAYLEHSAAMSPAFETLGGRAVLADVLNVVPSAEAAHASPCKRHKPDTDIRSSASASSVWSQARQQLRSTTSAGPPQGREQQYQRLSALLSQFEEDGNGCSVYVSGVPGTGKSHTVSRAVQQLQNAGSSCGVVWINCMSATSVADVCGQVLANASSSSSASTPPKQQQVSTTAQLSGELAKLQQRAARRGKAAAGCSHVLVLDEIDHLLACGPQAMYDLFLLPQQPNLRVLVIGIANSIDLTERALPQLKLLGCTPELLCFTAYTTKQITAILEEALSSLPCR